MKVLETVVIAKDNPFDTVQSVEFLLSQAVSRRPTGATFSVLPFGLDLSQKSSANCRYLTYSSAKVDMQKRTTKADLEVAKRLKLLRMDRGFSQTSVGQQLGVTFQQVQKYEKGTNRISAGRLQKLAKLFDVPITYFYGTMPMSIHAQNTFVFLETAKALRLLKAFSKIKNEKHKAALVNLAESLSRTPTDPG